MADGGRYRKRRHAVFAAAADGRDRARAASAALPEPRLQPAEWRHRALVRAGLPEIGEGPSMTAILATCRDAVRAAEPGARLAHRGASVPHRGPRGRGRPPDAGGHASRRRRLRARAAGRPPQRAERHDSIHAPDGRTLGSFTLPDPMDAALVDDLRVMHGVTPVQPIDPSQPRPVTCWS